MPPNFRHIARACGLRPEYRGPLCCYFKGRGRRWRINDRNEFQMGDDDFDRWANSVSVSISPPPRTRADLMRAIRAMRETENAK